MLVPLLLPLVAAPLGDPTPFVTTPSGVHAGGGLNTLAWDPSAAGRVLIGGDNSGVHVSIDHGVTWRASNRGLTTREEVSVAALVYDSSGSRVYLGAGSQGEGGGLFYSDDSGESWSLGTEQVSFSGKRNLSMVLPAGIPAIESVPRSVGDLIAIDEANGLLWCATYQDGLFAVRASDFAVAPGPLAFGPDSGTGEVTYLRSLLLNPTNPSQLFVGTLGKGVWRLDLDLTGPFPQVVSQIPVAPLANSGEDILWNGGYLYVAAGQDGLFLADPHTGLAVSLPLPPTPAGEDDPFWQSLARTDVAGFAVLWAGCSGPVDLFGDGASDAVVVSLDWGFNWFSLVDETNVDDDIAGTGGTYWHSDAGASVCGVPTTVVNELGGPLYRAADLAVDPLDGSRMLVAGPSAPYRFRLADLGWDLVVSGLQLTAATAIEVAPDDEVWMGMFDWHQLRSSDSMATVPTWDRALGSPRGATDFAFGKSDLTFVALTGQVAGAPEAQILAHDPSNVLVVPPGDSCGDWKVIGDDADFFGDPNWRPISLEYGEDESGEPLLIAALSRFASGGSSASAGIWTYRIDDDAWSAKTTTAIADDMLQGHNPRISMHWAGGAAPLWVHNPESGLWASFLSAGLAWGKIVDGPALSPTDYTGFLQPDPLAPNCLWLSTDQGLRRSCFSSWTVVPDVSVSAAVNAGPLIPLPGGAHPGAFAALPSGDLLVSSPAAPSPGNEEAGLWCVDVSAMTIEDVADDRYRRSALFPRDLELLPPTAAGEQRFGVALDGQGFVVGARTVP